MYPRIHWELVADPLGSMEYSLGTTGVCCMSPSFWGCCSCVVGTCLCHGTLMSVCALVAITRVFSVKCPTARSAVPVGPTCDAGEFPCSCSSSVPVSTVRATVAVDRTVHMTPFVSKQNKLQHGAVEGHRIVRVRVPHLPVSFVPPVRMTATLQPFPTAQCHNHALAGLVQREPHTLSDRHADGRLKGSVSAASTQQLCSVRRNVS